MRRSRSRETCACTEALLNRRGVQHDPLCGLQYAQQLLGIEDPVPVTAETERIFNRIKREKFSPFVHNVYGKDIRSAVRMMQRYWLKKSKKKEYHMSNEG